MKKFYLLLISILVLVSCTSNNDEIPVDCAEPSSLSASDITSNSAILNWTSNNQSNTYELQYGTEGFTLGNGQSVSTANTTYNLSNLTPDTNYEFYVRAICDATNSSGWSVLGSFTTLILCPDATTSEAVTIDAMDATLQWTFSGQAPSSWMVEYGETGFVIGQGTMANTTTNSIDLIDLTPSTEYEYYITSGCSSSNQGNTVGPFVFTTLPPANPNCSDPFNFIVTDQYVDVIGGISVPYAFFEWEADSATGDDFLIYYTEAGNTPDFMDFANVVNVYDNPVNNGVHAVGLGSVFTVNVVYDVYISKLCPNNEQSRWVGPVEVNIPN